MSTKVTFVSKQTCTELLDSVLRQAAEGVKFPVREADAVVAQLKNCLADGFISASQYDEAIDAILTDDQRGSNGPGERPV
jgi:hypothetical protein